MRGDLNTGSKSLSCDSPIPFNHLPSGEGNQGIFPWIDDSCGYEQGAPIWTMFYDKTAKGTAGYAVLTGLIYHLQRSDCQRDPTNSDHL